MGTGIATRTGAAAALLLLLLLLAACKQEPDFEERYEMAEKHIRTQASEIEAELAANKTLHAETDTAVEASRQKQKAAVAEPSR